MTSNTFYNTEQLAIVTENIIQPSCGERVLETLHSYIDDLEISLQFILTNLNEDREVTVIFEMFILMGPMMTTATETEQLPQQNAQQKWTQRSKLINTANAIILPVYLNCGFNIT
ncbi:unnamed protein product [Rhizophagus irregularis]|nr:unnamed protein product [Rhizophagus irregularis]CAB4428593.1 unnamed protein product [Rhizophagus irregularis]